MLFNFSKKFDVFHALLYSDSRKGNVHDVDSRKTILDNIIGHTANHISLPLQTHSNKVVWAKESYAHERSDGILCTGKEGEYISIQVADCVPIYMIDIKKGFCGLVHSGWRGSLKSIVLEAIRMFEKRESNLSDLKFFLGPHIHQQDYEVDYDVASKFPENCIKENGNKWLLNISKKIVNDLNFYGISNKQIDISDISSFSDTRCQSYRRDGNDAGRMYAFIGKEG